MRVFIDTLGCPKNITDSEGAAGILERAGHRIVTDPSAADAIMINTCGFINDAKEESINRILDMVPFKDQGSLLIVTGCLSQRYGNQLSDLLPEVDLLLGVNEYHNLPNYLEELTTQRKGAHFEPWERVYKEFEARKSLGSSYSAYLKIAEGCDNVCAYCIIPSIRGGYRSRTKENILKEARELADAGCKELILVAQDVTAYGIDFNGEFQLPDLLEDLCKIDEIRWIRLMYCYEDRITDRLIQTIKNNEKICNYLDIPIQHASDAILSSMNRRSTRASIEGTMRRLREEIPDIHIRTTLITGFPGETKEDFSALVDLIEEIKFERLGVFAYSKEEGTEAARRKDQIRKQTKLNRKDRIMEMQRKISYQHNKDQIGKTIEVLVEEIGEDHLIGRTAFDAPDIDNSVIFTSELALHPGEFVQVEITDAFDYDLFGRSVPSQQYGGNDEFTK
jgi:ribosomal protein S12 methylthiotransferase